MLWKLQRKRVQYTIVLDFMTAQKYNSEDRAVEIYLRDLYIVGNEVSLLCLPSFDYYRWFNIQYLWT